SLDAYLLHEKTTIRTLHFFFFLNARRPPWYTLFPYTTLFRSWRLARSLEVLRDEIRALHPGTTVWTIGDEAHLATWSDHNPNAAGVVCAIDVLADGGLDLGWFAEQVRTSGHPAFKYVIFNRRIASKGGGWRPYHGRNPHTSHVHVSVGVGQDGRSTGPYDNTSPWGVAGQAAGGDDVSAED